ncbi:sugar phosphate isomerase/epimerase family protein [Tundrisphaera sp. TA3]|uniref:sugar phosphate isomerase/epimerase family protein n=1 Tax=Tundrisphaera sp. TA3 TaxID=3435775 RepID=UPI003EBE2ED5
MIRISAFADEIAADPVEQIDVLARHGIRHIEFRSIHGINVLDLDRSQHEAFRSLLKERGVGLSAIGSPIGKIKANEPFEPHLERFNIALDLADFYETPRIRIFSYYIPAGDEPSAHRDEVVRRMAEKARIAADRGITLLLENEKGIYGDTADRVLDLLRAVDSPALSHAFDSANYLEVGQEIDEAWDLLRPRTTHIHVKDFDTKTHKNVPAGEGQGQIPRIIAEAVSDGFDGFCTLEPHLIVAAQSHGFTGPERFGDAARALQDALDRKGIAYA